jgi:diketogulonate reductase-like aldo/keto reductase
MNQAYDVNPESVEISGTPIRASRTGLLKLYEQAKILATGHSNFSVEQMERFREVAPLAPLNRS